MRLPSEGPMPRHLLNAVHWDVKPRPTADTDLWDGRRGACGRGDVMATLTPADVTCKRCLKKNQEPTNG